MKVILLIILLITINCNKISNPLIDSTGCGDYKDIKTGYICDPDKYLKYEELIEY